MKEKELDFDELHQAVSQMMDKSGKPKAAREPVATTPKVSSRPPVKVSERPTNTPAAPADVPDRGETIAVRRPAVARITPKKRGMAMDVIQAAKPAQVTPPSTRPTRTGAALQPTGPVVPEPIQAQPASEPNAPTPPSEVSDDTLASLDMQKDGFARPKTVVEEPPKPHPAVKPTFPDPLDVHGFNDENRQKESPETAIEPPKPETGPKDSWDPLLDETPEPQPQPLAEPEPHVPAPELSATPFVNAKVDKRPLGAFASHAPATPQPKPVAEPQATNVEPAPAEPTPEAPDATWSSPAQEQPTADDTQPEPALDTQASQTPLDHLRGASIPPQYHAAEKEPAQDDRPIFDTKNYHTPIEAHATPRRAGSSHAGIILTVILIILLIAAGVAAYFVATGGIDLQRLF